MLLYGETHAEGLDAHWQADFPGKRTMILARSGGLSSAAHGTVLWSGDISASWDVLRGQVTEAVRSAMSGLHYWTLDIGGFFTDKKEQWFWNGSYPEGTADPAYRELYARWFQFGAMLPVFRSHGTDTPREPWRFEEQYPVIRDTIRLRYRLLPYLYSTAAQACQVRMQADASGRGLDAGGADYLLCIGHLVDRGAERLKTFIGFQWFSVDFT
jgi:alpha-D-xyloside xylohydrolase